MARYLIVKQKRFEWEDFEIVGLIDSDEDPAEAIKQGYRGNGRYAIVNWDERVECDLVPGEVAAQDVQDKAARVALAEAAAEEPQAK